MFIPQKKDVFFYTHGTVLSFSELNINIKLVSNPLAAFLVSFPNNVFYCIVFFSSTDPIWDHILYLAIVSGASFNL